MREKLKQERNLEKIKALLLKHGIEHEIIEEAIAEAPTFQDAISRQGEAVLLFLEEPAKFTAKLCKRCGEPFSTNYRYVAYCTDICRAKEISSQTGVSWDWMKSENERWGFKEPPLVIPPQAFKKLQKYVAVLQSRSLVETEPTQPQPILPDPLSEAELHKILDNSPTNPLPQPAQLEPAYTLSKTDDFFGPY